MLVEEISMRRRVTLVVSSCLAAVLGVLPIAATIAISRHLTLNSEQTRLAAIADVTLGHAQETFAQVQSTLTQLNATQWSGCSPEHLLQMRRLTIEDAAAEEIGFYSDGALACTGWGPVEGTIPQELPDFVLPTGAGLHLDAQPEVTRAGKLIIMDWGQHNALIKPERLISILPVKEGGIVVATADGRLLSSSGSLREDVVRKLLSGQGQIDDKYLRASSANDGLVAIAVVDASAVTGWLDEGRWMLIPLAVLMSSLFVGLVVLVSRQRLSLRSDVMHALKNGEFIPYYQPIIELSTGRCIGAEALVRWRQPNGTLVAPDLFIPYVEQDDLILELTGAVIRQVAADLGSTLLGEDIHIAINISARDMEAGRFLSILDESARRAGVEPARIWIEVTERGFVDVKLARGSLVAAREAGHKIAIDDFGTGYSSLALLESLPLDALKIDKSFVGAIGRGAASSIVTPHIIEMAHGLGLSIVAEGVETLEQEAYLRAARVEFAQGWLYSKALPVVEFADYLRARKGGLSGLKAA
jgi:sensor c-di-GMP phosphodiesterase-like protein